MENVLIDPKLAQVPPGTWVTIEVTRGRIVRLAWRCPDCRTVWYDFSERGIADIRDDTIRRTCDKCIALWDRRRAEWFSDYANYGPVSRAFPMALYVYPAAFNEPFPISRTYRPGDRGGMFD